MTKYDVLSHCPNGMGEANRLSVETAAGPTVVLINQVDGLTKIFVDQLQRESAIWVFDAQSSPRACNKIVSSKRVSSSGSSLWSQRFRQSGFLKPSRSAKSLRAVARPDCRPRRCRQSSNGRDWRPCPREARECFRSHQTEPGEGPAIAAGPLRSFGSYGTTTHALGS